MPHPQPAELLAGDFPDSLPTGGRIVAAAVLMAIVEHPRPTLLLTRRTDTLRRHEGQAAFPGGRVDPEDSGIVEDALRVADEVVGLPPATGAVIGGQVTSAACRDRRGPDGSMSVCDVQL